MYRRSFFGSGFMRAEHHQPFTVWRQVGIEKHRGCKNRDAGPFVSGGRDLPSQLLIEQFVTIARPNREPGLLSRDQPFASTALGRIGRTYTLCPSHGAFGSYNSLPGNAGPGGPNTLAAGQPG